MNKKHFAILTLWTVQFRFSLGIVFVWVTLPCELPDIFPAHQTKRAYNDVIILKKVKR